MLITLPNRRAAALALTFSWLQCVIAPVLVQAAPIDVPNGMPVDLVFQSTVNAESAIVGQTIMLNVANDVRIAGKVVIAQGAVAQGEIITAQKRGSVGKAATIQIILRNVQAVDGTSIALTGQKQVAGQDKQTQSLVVTLLCCILALLQKGGPAEIPAGSTVRGTIVGPVSVEA